jgi:AcrR family transcriptional regulator
LVPRSQTLERPGARRKQILDAALRIIGERGYHGFGLQELATRCGLTKAGLLHHFGSKDRLLIALLREREARDESAIVASLRDHASTAGDEGTSPDVLVEVFRAIVLRNTTQPELIRLSSVLRTEALNENHPAHGYFRQHEAAKLAIVEEMLAPFVEHARSTARQIIALMSGLEEQWLREGAAVDLVAEWDRAASKLFK